jgi:hypothetical protein
MDQTTATETLRRLHGLYRWRGDSMACQGCGIRQRLPEARTPFPHHPECRLPEGTPAYPWATLLTCIGAGGLGFRDLDLSAAPATAPADDDFGTSPAMAPHDADPLAATAGPQAVPMAAPPRQVQHPSLNSAAIPQGDDWVRAECDRLLATDPERAIKAMSEVLSRASLAV